MKKNRNAEKRCINCGRIIVDETNKTGVVAGVKKYGKQIVQGLAKLVLKR